MFEYGENERFRFATEPLALLLALLVAKQLRERLTRPERRPPPAPGS